MVMMNSSSLFVLLIENSFEKTGDGVAVRAAE
jgi:hypothetical protein